MREVSLIVAVSENGVIGQNGQLLWHLPNDLKHFKALTWGKPIIMGRKTFESIGRVLPGRQNIVLTKNAFSVADVNIVHSVEEALGVANGSEIMIIGGGEIYRLFSPFATMLYITYVHAVLEGDTFWSGMEDNKEEWKEIARESHQRDERHAYDYDFVTLARIGR